MDCFRSLARVGFEELLHSTVKACWFFPNKDKTCQRQSVRL